MGNTPPPTRAPDIAAALAHLRHTDPRGFHVAVKGERVVAFASTILRGNTHFLSMFWALPVTRRLCGSNRCASESPPRPHDDATMARIANRIDRRKAPDLAHRADSD
jgi:hypothetical protein